MDILSLEVVDYVFLVYDDATKMHYQTLSTHDVLLGKSIHSFIDGDLFNNFGSQFFLVKESIQG